MRSAERKESEVRSQKSEYGREYVVSCFLLAFLVRELLMSYLKQQFLWSWRLVDPCEVLVQTRLVGAVHHAVAVDIRIYHYYHEIVRQRQRKNA